MAKTRTLQKKNFMDIFSGKQILIPIVALVLLAVFNLIADPSFYKITLDVNSAGNHVLSGYLITILDYGSELAILAIGMTLVTAASGGQDISVGAGIAIAGSVILRVLCGTNSRPDHLQAPIIVAFLVSCVVAMLFGAFNGILVAGFKIQPMVATLILYTAGRSIAAWINNNELPVISDPSFGYFGGFIPGIRPGKPTSDYLTKILNYIVFIGAIGLTIVCVIPFIFNGVFGAQVSFGGTSLIIIVSVILETMKQVESQMLVRNYKGFLND